MTLTKELLDVILVVQSFKAYKMRESRILNNKLDWFKQTERYYYDLPAELLSKIGLKKNMYDFEKVLSFKITDKVLRTECDQLAQFNF